MKIKKEHFIVSIIIILFAFLLFLPNIVALIPSEEIKQEIVIIFSILVFLFLIYLTYDDIRKREYTTTLYIVLLDIIGIINLAVIFYIYFIYSKRTNTEVILLKINIRIVALLILLCSSILLKYLKSEKFMKKNEF